MCILQKLDLVMWFLLPEVVEHCQDFNFLLTLVKNIFFNMNNGIKISREFLIDKQLRLFVKNLKIKAKLTLKFDEV